MDPNRSCLDSPPAIPSGPAGNTNPRRPPLVGEPLPLTWRWTLGGVSLGLIALLAVARGLEPNAQGYGTHRDLGLPPCTFRMIFGKPCPSCGMTTSWALLTRGRLVDAMRANAGGVLLALVVLLVAPCLAMSAYYGRWWPGWPGDWSVLCVTLVVVSVTLVDWWRRW